MKRPPSLTAGPQELQAAGVRVIPRYDHLDRHTNVFYVGVYCLKCRRRWTEPMCQTGFVRTTYWKCPNGCNWRPAKRWHGQPESW